MLLPDNLDEPVLWRVEKVLDVLRCFQRPVAKFFNDVEIFPAGKPNNLVVRAPACRVLVLYLPDLD